MIPLRRTNNKISEKWPKNIIIHHTACKLDITPIRLDKANFQTDKFELLNAQLLNRPGSSGFNFIIEKVHGDYTVVVSQPLLTICEWDDISPEYENAVHIGLLGNYDIEIPTRRLYKVLSFEIIIPLMRLFGIKQNDILLYNTISEDEISCPGENFNIGILYEEINSLYQKKRVRRNI